MAYSINPNLPNIRIQDQALADWINNQKKNFRLGKLKQSQISDLLRIGVELSKENSLERFWTDMYEYYQLYIKEYGTMKVSRKLDPSLGYWITNQRTAKKLGLLSAEKLDKLNSIGFIW